MIMSATGVWAPPRSAISSNFGGLLERLEMKHGIKRLDPAGFDGFLSEAGAGVVLLTEEPDVTAESWDLAVLFPELLASVGASLRAALMSPADAKPVQQRFGIGQLPALLFVRDGGYVGAIEGLRDWNEFVAEFAAQLQKPVSRAPSIGITVAAASTTCH